MTMTTKGEKMDSIPTQEATAAGTESGTRIAAGLVAALERSRPGMGNAAAANLTEAARELLDDNKAMRSRQEGEVVDDFALPDASGRTVTLSKMLARGPVVLTFYRGGWCGYCSAYLRALDENIASFRDAGAEVVAISPQTLISSADTVEKLQVEFPVLSDLDNVVAKAFGLVYVLPEAFRDAYIKIGIDLPATNGTTTFELPVPATYIIGIDRRIAYVDVDPDYTRRPEPGALLERLRLLHRPAVQAG